MLSVDWQDLEFAYIDKIVIVRKSINENKFNMTHITIAGFFMIRPHGPNC